MNNQKHLLILFVFFIISGCQWLSSSKQNLASAVPSSKREAFAGLSQAHALYRRKVIQNLDYQLELDLTSDQYYSGKIKIKLDIKEPANLTLDFTGGEIDGFQINGFTKKIDYNSFFIQLRKQDLSAGNNLIEFQYRHPYGRESGLIRFVDPKDQKIYIYSDFDIYGANQIWPCFDQPDILAPIELIVKTPKDWQVTSSSPQGGVDYAGGIFYWQFPRSQKITPQQMSLAAGFFKIWERNISTPHHAVFLRLFARQSVADKVPFDDIFLATKNGLNFFEKEFAAPYGFSKYDQVLVPDRVKAPLGSVAASIFDEKDILMSGRGLYLKKRRLTQMVLQKLSLWWLGQNTTPDWWSDLWLFQGFSIYASYEALMNGTLFFDGDQLFIGHEKRQALLKNLQIKEDLRERFQAVRLEENPVLPEEVVSGFFFFRQFKETHGQVELRQFLKKLFMRYSSMSLSSPAFFTFLREQVPSLTTSHLKAWPPLLFGHRLRVQYKCDQMTSSQPTIEFDSQTSSQDFNPLKIKLTAYRFDGPRIVELRSADILLKSKKQWIRELDGLNCERLAFVLLDPNNQNFISTSLDDRSLKNIQMHLSEVEDDAIRFDLWVLLRESTESGELKYAEYLQAVLTHLTEKETLGAVALTLENTARLISALVPEEQKKWTQLFAQKSLQHLTAASTEDLQKTWLLFYLQLNLQSISSTQTLKKWLKQPHPLLKKGVDQEAETLFRESLIKNKVIQSR